MAKANDSGKKSFFSKEGFANVFTKENIARAIFIALAAFSILAVFAIIFFVLYESIPAFKQIGFFNFIFGQNWLPNISDQVTGEIVGQYGIFKKIITSICLTGLSVLIGSILGIFTAVFIVYYCPKKLKSVFTQIINLLAGIPSIIFGYFGMSFLDGILVDLFGVLSGSGLLLSSIVLSIMIVPTITSLTKNSLENVPLHYYEGSLALGNTKNQTVFKVMLPAARNGIISAIILGTGRAIGEAMAIKFLLGQGDNYPSSFFLPINSLTSSIVTEWSYAGGLQRQALIATGFILLIFILIINLALFFIKTNDAMAGNKFFSRKFREGQDSAKTYDYKRTGSVQDVFWILSYVFALIVVVSLLAVIIFVIVNAFTPNEDGLIELSWEFLFGRSKLTDPTLAPAFTNTLWIILIALAVALPIGVGAAIYLNEYAKRGSKFVKVVRLFMDTLAGVPSIIFGLFGYILFVLFFKLDYSILGGGLTMALIILPTIIRSTEQSLSEVPDSMREASLALGASKVRTVFVVVLPQAIRGIITAIILSVGRIVGESAALIYTAGTSFVAGREGIFSPGGTFAVLMYVFMGEGKYNEKAYATGFILLILVLFINILVMVVQWAFERDKEKPLGIVTLWNKITRKHQPAAVAETDGGDFSEIAVSDISVTIPTNEDIKPVKLEEEEYNEEN